MYSVRRRRWLLAAGLAFLAVTMAFAAVHRPLNAKSGVLDDKSRVITDTDESSLSAVTWPHQGQAALVLGDGRPAASPHEQPAAIASLAKVMTAYLTLERYPLKGSQDGFTVTVSAAEAAAVARARAEGQSVVAVQAGERLAERQLLEALLIPSGNNIAQILAVQLAGRESRFISQMNAAARALGMDHTVYTDPSGFDPGTVSTAADQLRVFQQAMRFPVFRQIVSMPSVTLPVAGTLMNYNPLILDGYAGKTGSDSAAGGCLAFFTPEIVGGRQPAAVGVVLGQGHGNDTRALLAAAAQAAQQLVNSVALARMRTIPLPAAAASPGRDAGNHRGARVQTHTIASITPRLGTDRPAAGG
ncbi:MAG: D-alanyl-D-alanine carboxypeptidase family protein [Solirubrobacteraceae bacterium]